MTASSEYLQLVLKHPESIPTHVGVIMDGNRRWANKHKFSLLKGYDFGAKRADEISRWAMDAQVKVLSLWAWSTENFKRDTEQTGHVMQLFKIYFQRYLDNDFLVENDIRVKMIGQIDRMPPDVLELARKLEEKTAAHQKMVLQLCIAYGGRQEIVDATVKLAQQAAAGQLDPAAINAELLNEHMYFSGPGPDLIIRTGGEQRSSGFLLWHTDYSEWFFAPQLFPDFTAEHFFEAIYDYQSRSRRFGK